VYSLLASIASFTRPMRTTPQLLIGCNCVFTCSPDRWSYYGDYMYCQMQRYYADENDLSPITDIKDFIRHVRSLEEKKTKGLFRAPFLAELELIWKLREAKLQHLLELGIIVYTMLFELSYYGTSEMSLFQCSQKFSEKWISELWLSIYRVNC